MQCNRCDVARNEIFNLKKRKFWQVGQIGFLGEPNSDNYKNVLLHIITNIIKNTNNYDISLSKNNYILTLGVLQGNPL